MPELSPAQRELVRRILHHRMPERSVRIFGSRASGPAKPWSDLDLAILGNEPVDDLALAQARADFEESDLPFRVDLSLWRDLPDGLRQSIKHHGKPL